MVRIHPDVMCHRLKNVGAIYQRMVNMMFTEQIGQTMEVYIDDMLVKSKLTTNHVQDLNLMFKVLHKYQIKPNLLKYGFGVESGKFLGFIINQKAIEANPKKIQALLKMQSPHKPNEVQSLAGRVTALRQFVSRANDKCLPFFDALKRG